MYIDFIIYFGNLKFWKICNLVNLGSFGIGIQKLKNTDKLYLYNKLMIFVPLLRKSSFRGHLRSVESLSGSFPVKKLRILKKNRNEKKFQPKK